MSQFDDVENSFTGEQVLILSESAIRIYAHLAVENALSTNHHFCGELTLGSGSDSIGSDPWSYLAALASLPRAQPAGATPKFGAVSRWNSGVDAYTSAPEGGERPFLTAVGTTLSGVI